MYKSLIISILQLIIVAIFKEELCTKPMAIHVKLARKFLKNHAKLISTLKDILLSKEFLQRHRKSDRDFIRNRQLPFHLLIIFLLNIVRSAIQHELDNFFKTLFHSELIIKCITKSAFSKARRKISYTAFIELFNKQIEFFYNNYQVKTWRGFILKAVDGSTLLLPKNEDTSQYFGEVRNKHGKKTSVMAKASQIFDCLNKTTTSAVIMPIKVGEREMLRMQFDSLNKNDLLLLDRGYPSYWLFSLLTDNDIKFCARISINQWNVIKDFNASNEHDQVIELQALAEVKRRYEIHGVKAKPIQIRLVKIRLDTGENEILVTNLNNQKEYQYSIFKELYQNRWPVEEDYKIMKHRLEVENFSGKSTEAVHQDFFAKLFTKNLTSILHFNLHKKINEKKK